MKHTLVFAFFLVLSFFKAQENNPISFSEVVKVDSTRLAADLFPQAKMWFVEAFKNSKAVIQMEDLNNKTIIGNASIPYSSRFLIGSGTTVGKITYQISIACKDGRYKYDITNFIHEGKSMSFGYLTTAEDPKNKFGPTGTRIKVHKEMKDIAEREAIILINALKSFMSQNKVSTKEDW